MTWAVEATGRRGASNIVYATFGEGLCLRLIGAPDTVLGQVAAELGAVDGPPEEPILTVRFVDSVRNRAELTKLGLTDHPFAFDAERFYLVGRRGHLTALDLGLLETAEIQIERGEASIPLLMPILAVRLAAAGRVLLHAASFLHRGRAVVVTGWQSGGKSEILFAFMDRGATYLADEWTVVRGDGSIDGIASDVHFWAWQLDALPRVSARIPKRDRRRVAALRLAARATGRVRGDDRHGYVRRSLADLEGWLGNAARIRIDPERVFEGRVHRGAVRVDDLLMASVGGDEARSIPSDGRKIAERIVASLEYERRELLAVYAQYRYAFPDRRSDLLERAPRLERDILEGAFAGVTAHEVRHPYPPSFPDLYRVVEPLLEREGA